MQAERILITGATGFIGRPLVKRLIADGVAVSALVREKPGAAWRDRLPDPVEVIECDLRYAAGVKRAIMFTAPALVLHLAAVGVTDPFLSTTEALRGNLDATINLLKAVAGRCRVILARTSSEIDLLNPYAASKAAAWQFGRMFHRTEGWPIVGAMVFQAYGPGQSERTALGAALKAARAGEPFPMTSGEQRRDWIYIDEVVDGILAVAGAGNIEGETIEIGTGIATPVRAVVARVFQLAGQGQPLIGALPQRPGETLEQVADASRAEKLTGWRTRIGIEEGLQKVLEHE